MALRHSHQFIIIVLSLASFLHNILMNGANNVILSSLQKEFFLSSRETGIYVSVYDIGSLLSSIIISFASARGSKPRWIAFGLVALFFGCMIATIPHFIRSNEDAAAANAQHEQHMFDHAAATANNSSINEDAAAAAAGFTEESSIELCNFSMSYNDKSHDKARKVLRALTDDDVIVSPSTSSSPPKKGYGNGWFGGYLQLKHILYLGNMINGLSSASLTTITFSYIEEIAPPNLSAVYESIYYAIGAFGVGVGFIITSKFLTVHTDVNVAGEQPAWLKPSHPNWIGAWWLPFVLFGFVSLIIAAVIFTFPRKILYKPSGGRVKDKKKKTTTPKRPIVRDNELVALNGKATVLTASNGDANANGNVEDALVSSNTDSEAQLSVPANGSCVSNGNGNGNGKHHLHHSQMLDTLEEMGSILSLNNAPADASHNMSEMMSSTWALLRKPVYLFVILATAIEGLLQTSFLAFAALFLEYQYRLASGSASLILGFLSIPPLMIGGIMSGVIVKRLNNNTISCLKFLALVLFFNMIVYAGFMIHCKEANMITDRFGTPQLQQQQQQQQHKQNLSDYSLATDCNCNMKIFKPVCLTNSNDVFFQSACLAGCSEFDKHTDIYSNCTQVPTTYPSSSPAAAHFINGLCPTNDCDMRLVVSYACIFFLMLLNALTFLPYLKVTIGVINDKHMNSIGLGLKQFSMNALGTIPGPIIFGSVIDSTCTYWHNDLNNQRVCKIYNNEQFAHAFGLLGIGFKAVCLVFVIVCLVMLRKQRRDNQTPALLQQPTGTQQQTTATAPLLSPSDNSAAIAAST